MIATRSVLNSTARTLGPWAAWVVFALLLMPLVGTWAWLYLVCVTVSALVVSRFTRTGLAQRAGQARSHDLAVIAILYVAIIALMRLAFVGFGTEHIPGLFLSFAGALLLGVLGPVYYTVRTCEGSLADLGIRRDNWAATAVLAVVFAGVQFAITLWGYALPAPVDWVPLLVMALVVGVFESVFFRGFVQNGLEARFGSRVGIGGAAVLYGAYHVGYGMGLNDIVFLTGLGVTYAVSFALARNVLVLWPLLTPIGSFYSQLKNGNIELPWASILGFTDVAMIMIAMLWVAHRHDKKRAAPPPSHSGRWHEAHV